MIFDSNQPFRSLIFATQHSDMVFHSQTTKNQPAKMWRYRGGKGVSVSTHEHEEYLQFVTPKAGMHCLLLIFLPARTNRRRHYKVKCVCGPRTTISLASEARFPEPCTLGALLILLLPQEEMLVRLVLSKIGFIKFLCVEWCFPLVSSSDGVAEYITAIRSH